MAHREQRSFIDDGMSLFASMSWADANPVYTAKLTPPQRGRR